jgi:hypothetical protein
VTSPQPWTTADATNYLNQLCGDIDLDVHLTNHAKERMDDRSLVVGDLLHVLKRGFVYEPPEPSTRPKFFKYAMRSKTPNSGSRDLCVIVIPDPANTAVKIVTVMWVDET